MRRPWPRWCAVLGHMFPVWLKFRGGKGVATGFGVFLVAAPLAALAAISVFFVVLALTRYVSLASILGAASFPPFAWFLVKGERPAFFIAVQCAVALLIIVKHHQNIRRLLAGTESRFGAQEETHEPYCRTGFRSVGNRHRPGTSPPRRPPDHSLVAHAKEEAAVIAAARENTLFLPGFPLADSIHVTADADPVAQAEIVVSVIPSEFLRPTIARLRPYFRPGQIIVSATKGIENESFLRMTEVIASALGAGEPTWAQLPSLAANSDVHLEVFTEPDAPEVSSSGIAAAPATLDGLDLSFGAFSGPDFRA